MHFQPQSEEDYISLENNRESRNGGDKKWRLTLGTSDYVVPCCHTGATDCGGLTVRHTDTRETMKRASLTSQMPWHRCGWVGNEKIVLQRRVSAGQRARERSPN